MRRVAALLAAVLGGVAVAGCGDGAEPGAPEGASLVLDFQPNAVHAPLYAARAADAFAEQGIELEIREPSSSADGARLLEAGRADFAILDINDFGIARQRGLEIVAFGALVQRPLAAVIAADREQTRSPADLRGRTVGVTGVPSDDAVLDTVLAEGGVDPDEVERQTIGFQSVALLAAGKVDAATAFWNAEGVELRRRGVPIREFRVDELGAPRYPELVLATRADDWEADPERACGLLEGLGRGYERLEAEPSRALRPLLDAASGLDPDEQEAQLRALNQAAAFGRGERASPTLNARSALAWVEWAQSRGVLRTGPEIRRIVSSGFPPDPSCP